MERSGAMRQEGDVVIDSLAPRKDFPLLEEVTYLNAASMGLVPLPVQEQAAAFDRELALRGTTWFDEEQETFALERARHAAARLLNACPESIAITTSMTEALCQVAWWLRPGRGTNIVSIDLEFPSVVYPWYRVAAETGAEVRLVPVRDDPATLSLQKLAALVDDDTAVICVSHVQFATGFRFALEDLTALARAHDALLVVDATQSAGMVPLDMTAQEIDVLLAGGYKWLGAMFGAAVCYLGVGFAVDGGAGRAGRDDPHTATDGIPRRHRHRSVPGPGQRGRRRSAQRGRGHCLPTLRLDAFLDALFQ